jgi:formylglycine-generating enzyme required for sulfatase activity
VGRFRQFIAAWNNGSGYTPAAGSGKHAHLNAGKGLANNGSGGGYESGWSTSDNGSISPTNGALQCSGTPSFATWTNTPAGNEDKPINCINWYEAQAFCIWDGGFLPSNAEWEYAAVGGSQELEYPWGSANPGTASQYAIFGDYSYLSSGNPDCYYPATDGGAPLPCTGPENIASVGTAASGAGRWGQLDLVGELWQWELDWYPSSGMFIDPSVDAAYLTAVSDRVSRGGAFADDVNSLGGTGSETPATRNDWYGFRCARSP